MIFGTFARGSGLDRVSQGHKAQDHLPEDLTEAKSSSPC